MVELKYKSWSKTPIRVYNEIRDILTSEDDRPEEKDVYILSTLSGLDVDEVMDLSLFDFERLAHDAAFVYTQIPHRPGGLKSIVVDGKRFDVQTDFNKVTTAQYMDFTNFTTDIRKYYPNILATFILPHGKRYNDGYDASEVAELFNDKLDIATAESALAFFLTFITRSTRITLGLYSRKLKRIMRKEKDPEIKEKMQKVLNALATQRELIGGLATSML